jgi:hypothetical protein
MDPINNRNNAKEELDLLIEALDLSGIDVLEEDIVPCSCCGGSCNSCG